MKITKEQFKKLAKKHLIALEGYDIDRTIEIFGVERLYDEVIKIEQQINKNEKPINIQQLKKGDLIKSLKNDQGKGVEENDIFKVYLTGNTFGEYWADIAKLDRSYTTSISAGYDDYDWELIK